ncbi:5384_t:CDS:2 [Funneliformis geosporum]|uniref:10867_t:CDS:1 n=1 Tax=Funneliformis geosporum TaxID=1117311 RepID=A0A9W4SP55_9GLOM|nr:10867_t:CDS:2 [Funneliformis geosporum]CAI2185233.1 5384_t:CDS:2 [Funneliformis geosporum]
MKKLIRSRHKLIDLNPQHMQCSFILEICASDRLYNIKNEVVVTQLITNRQLWKHVIIIPLNRIQAYKLSAERLTNAKRMAPEKVDLALTLIGYDHETAIEYIFENTLIITNANRAKKVNFNRNVQTKSVIIEGDVYDPTGTL